MIMYIDSLIIINFVKWISLITTFIIKFNLRFIRVSQYLQWFKLNIKYKLNKRNIILNILSRL